jgi:pimeloyl-ACP methyl ester carboxylesterase
MSDEQSGWSSQSTGTGAYADVNGLHMYYETLGSGRPLVLIHGGFGAGTMFGANTQALADAGYTVISPDLQGHGRTADIDRPIDVKLMAGDVAALIEHLGLDRPDVVGYSMGGGVAFFLALQRPELVNRLVIISTAMRDSAYYPELRAQQGQVTAEAAEFIKQTPMYSLYSKLAPRIEDWPQFVGKIGASMAGGFDHKAEVPKLQPPTLIMFADGDMSPPSHAAEIYGLLGGGQRDGNWDKSGLPKHQLAIVPGETHYSMGDTPKIVPVIAAFLAEGEKIERE